MKKILKALLATGALAFAGMVRAQAPAPRTALLERIRADVDVIGIVHWSVNSFQDREWGYGDEKPSLVAPSDFDAEQIVGACKAGGIKGLVVVAKHHDGFCLWPTKTTDHNISKSPFRGGRGDYMMEMSEACRRNGVRFGVYVSPWDRNNADYGTDRYVETFHEQIRELLGGRYGEVFEMWFDGANGGDGWYGGKKEVRRIKPGYYRFDEVFRFVRELQPTCCIFAGESDLSDLRWPGNERGFLVDDSRATVETVGGFANGEYGNPDYPRQINLGSPKGTFFRQCEADFPLREGWFYHPGRDATVKSPEFLMRCYLRTVGNGGIMNIGISPDRRGRLPDADAAALKGFAALKERFFANEVTSGTFNLVVLSEDVSKGERVVRWRVTTGGREILSGASIGTKRIRALEWPDTIDNLAVEAFDADDRRVDVTLKAYSVDRADLMRVLRAEPPARPREALGKGREIAGDRRTLTYRYDVRFPFANLIVFPDIANTDGAPVEFKVSLSDDGVTWRTLPATYRLDNVAANPVAQDIPLGSTNTAYYVRLEALRTVKDTAKVALAGLDIFRHKAKVGYHYDADFSVTDAVGQPYCIEVDRNSHYSHGHGKVMDGRYAILLDGNRHRLATPALGDFRLESDWSLDTVVDPYRVKLGWRLHYRYDRRTGRGNVLELVRDHKGRLTLTADGREIAARDLPEPAELKDAKLVLEVRGARARVETAGFAVDFDVAPVNAKGAIAFDASRNTCEQLYLKTVSVTTEETPAKKELTRQTFTLPAVQGFQEPLVYDVVVSRYESGETEFACTLSGGVASRGKRIETGGGEWTSVHERLTAPYLRFDGSANDVRKLYLWNGMLEFCDSKARKGYRPPCRWPFVRTFVLSDFTGTPSLAAGYDHAIASPWRFAENGPYEQIRSWDGKELYLGAALDGGAVATVAKSPADKKIVSKIPADLPRREQALAHARREHYFFASEDVRFALETSYDPRRWQKDEIAVSVRFADVYGKDLADGAFSLGEPVLAQASDSISRQTREARLLKNPGTGVYKLFVTTKAGAGEPKTDTVVFEVLPDDPKGPCPPLASGLPTFVSMPNETKYLEQNAFDPWADFCGVGHYYAVDNRYPAVGNALEIWRLLPAYRRRWWCWNWDRNSSDYAMETDFNRDLIRHADVYGGNDYRRNRQSRYDLGVLSFYHLDQLKFLRDFVAERKPPLKRLTLERLNALVAKGGGLTYPEFEDLFDTCWVDWIAYARPRIDRNTADFDRFVHDLNPDVGLAGYGPYAFYVSHYKTAYTMTYNGYSVEKEPWVRDNGSFWLFEEYHHSCDYPLFRGALFVATYDLYYGYGRKIYPEIYYSGWTRCMDGAVYKAHPLSRTTLADTHQRRVAYRYAYGTPRLRDGKSAFWTDYGFHARNPERAAMEEFVYAWGKLRENRPVRATKAPVAFFDHAAMMRNGDYLDRDCNPNTGTPGQLADVCNSAEEGLAYVYEQAVVNGYTTPVVTDFAELRVITPENAEYAILPPIVEGTPKDVLDGIRALHARGVNLIATREVVGLEDLFGVKRNPSGARPIGHVGFENFSNREAKALYAADGAKPVLFAAERAGAPDDIPLVLVHETKTGRTAFVNAPPANIRRASFTDVYHWGQDSLSVPLKKAMSEALAYLAPQPSVKAERGLAMSAWTENGDLAVILSEESPIYNDLEKYPVPFRFTVRAKGIGRAEISADAPYAVVRREDDCLVLRTETAKDTALFFRFSIPSAKGAK